MLTIAEQIADTARTYGFVVASCAENIDLNELGIEHNSCIDKELIEHIIGSKIIAQKDKTSAKNVDV